MEQRAIVELRKNMRPQLENKDEISSFLVNSEPLTLHTNDLFI